jgi:hypothetical protein
LYVDLLHAAAHWRRDLYLCLVRLHLEKRRVLPDHITLVNEDGDDLRLGQTFAEIRQEELARHVV